MDKKKIILFIPIVVLVVVGVYSIYFKSHSTDVASLIEKFYENDDGKINSYLQTVNKDININFHTVTLNEYILDPYTGIGIVLLSTSRQYYDDYYDNYFNNFYPRVKQEYLVSHELANTILTKERVYFYYRFTLNEKGKSKSLCKIYLDDDQSHYFELSFNDDISNKTFTVSDEKVICSPLGFTISTTKEKSNILDMINFNYENSVSMTDTNNSDNGVYCIGCFKNTINCDNISNLDEFIGLLE